MDRICVTYFRPREVKYQLTVTRVREIFHYFLIFSLFFIILLDFCENISKTLFRPEIPLEALVFHVLVDLIQPKLSRGKIISVHEVGST